jgi:hypothetical protein
LRHGFNVGKGKVLAVREPRDVAQIGHESVGVPAEEPHDLDISETHGVEDDAGADAQRMGRAKGQALHVGDRVKFVDCAAAARRKMQLMSLEVM